MSDHNNSDNYMAAPGKRNGAQHVHDYVGNKTTNAFTEHGQLNDGTSCGNGDQSAFFWPVLRDLNGTGPDVGEDGGSLDGQRRVDPQAALGGHRLPRPPGPEDRAPAPGPHDDHGEREGQEAGRRQRQLEVHLLGLREPGDRQVPDLPRGLEAEAAPGLPQLLDGKNLESKDFRSHIFFPDDNGRCDDDQTPVPQLRITLTYDQPAGRNFAIDSFPDNQHDPTTDHSDYENAASEAQNEAGADCINNDQRCRT